MVTDRPDFAESSEVVGPRRVQVETSVEFERDQGAGMHLRSRSTPTLLRIGLDERFELRVETDGALREDVHDLATGLRIRQTGMADTSLGMKWHTQDSDEDAGVPSTAWLFHVDLPTGSDAFRGRGWRPSARYVAEWELPQGFSVGMMPGVVWDKNEAGDRFASGLFALALGKDLAPGWSAIFELAAQQIASRRNGGNVYSFDAGVAWGLTDDLQLDASFTRGLNREAPDFQWALGLSARF
jgi:outer membrane receptor protein involved in Fe transport